MPKIVDARGRPCPEPVIMTKRGLETITEGIITVIVDSDVSKENVIRFSKSQGCSVQVEEKSGTFYIDVAKGYAGDLPDKKVDKTEKASGIALYIASDTMGIGDEKLGRILMKGFIKAIKEVKPRPSWIIFVNKGVFLTTEGSDLIEDIKAIEESGAEVLSCGTCLDFFNRKAKVKVGIISNMHDITNALMNSSKVIRP